MLSLLFSQALCEYKICLCKLIFFKFCFQILIAKVLFIYFPLPANDFLIIIEEEVVWECETVCDLKRSHWLTFAVLYSWHLWGKRVSRINFQIPFTFLSEIQFCTWNLWRYKTLSQSTVLYSRREEKIEYFSAFVCLYHCWNVLI